MKTNCSPGWNVKNNHQITSNKIILINYVILQAWPWEQNAPWSSFRLKLFWCYSTFPAEPRGGLRWESQMERTRAHNKDKWLEHEIWFIALVQKHSQGNSRHWHATNFKTLSNPKSTSYYNVVKFLRGLQENCGPDQSGCCFWWMFLHRSWLKMFKRLVHHN